MDNDTQLGLLTSLLIAFYIGNVDVAVKRLKPQAEHPEMVKLFDTLSKLRPSELRLALMFGHMELMCQISFN